MTYLCLYCMSELPAANPHGCNLLTVDDDATNHTFSGIVPMKASVAELKRSIAGNNTHLLEDFNPSCRKIAFDCIVDTTAHKVYVIVRCKFDFVRGPGAGAWSGAEKAQTETAVLNCVQFWDRAGALTYTSITGAVTAYDVEFFIDTSRGGAYRQKIRTQTADKPRYIGPQITMTCNALVPCGTGYADGALPEHGTGYQLDMQITQYSPMLFPAQNNNNACEVLNAMAHEFGHMIGLPDEYLAIPATWLLCASDSDRAAYLWTRRLVAENIAVPPTGPNYPALTMMNKIEARPTGFLDRHYVTVLEAARYTCARNGIAGNWSV
ncbi:MAG: hypothetical protein OEM00_06255 [Burkholderiaceae bacterium]|nr:hypothetical protein [Burkholderiaceae bacterium]